ncbi:chondroitin proteoglycan-2-like [Physella acuta]|uniref:chondroitin proteoglycan-2-like n=1 Tax=Physella acuta TaxID=109671 RepID=UPI0027DAD18D|nr:chondroitin proteoglycan-2-like [Physella acuta]
MMNSHVILNLFVLVCCLHCAVADMLEALSKVSSICRATPVACSKIFGRGVGVPSGEAQWCSQLRMVAYGVTGFQCGVSIGFCTDQEYLDLEKAACRKISLVPRQASNIKKTFYNKVATINPSCQDKIMHCIAKNVVSTVFKQQEQYCKLVNSRYMVECMGLDCLRDLNQTACTTYQSQPFSDAIVGTTQKCQDTIEECASNIYSRTFIRMENYCGVMYPHIIRFEDCLQQKHCTKAETNKLRIAACSSSGNGSGSGNMNGSGNGSGSENMNGSGNGSGSENMNGSGNGSGNINGSGNGSGNMNGSGNGSGNMNGSGNGSGSGSLLSTAMSKVSNMCKSTTKVCVSLSGKNIPESGSEAEWCTLMRMTKDGVTGYQCGVSIGFCTDQEFIDLEKAACGGTTKSPRQSSNAQRTFYNKVSSIRKSCQDRLIACVANNVVSTVFKQQEQYCKLVNSRYMIECMGIDCFRDLNRTGCSAYESQPFSDAIVGTAHTCQNALQECVFRTFALALIRAGKYCDAVDYSQDGINIAECLKENQCMEAEVRKLRTAACRSSGSGSGRVSGSYIVGSFLVLICAVLLRV